jgi:hypothetical protein
MGSFFRQLEPEFEIANDQSVLSSVKICYQGRWVGYMWGVPVGPLTTTCRKKKVIPNNKHKMWVEVRELCLPLATQVIMHGTNETNGQTIDVGGIVPVEFFFARFLLLRMCGKKLCVGMVSMKVLESCFRTEDVITYETIDVGCAIASRCLVYGRLHSTHLWTTCTTIHWFAF